MEAQLPCRPGTHSAAGAQSCIVCPAGKKCPKTDGTGIRDCQPGEYSIEGSTVCTACPKGYACPNNTMDYVIKCDPGFYAIGKKYFNHTGTKIV